MDIRKILREMVERGASDLHLKVGSPPTFRIDGQLVAMDLPSPTAKEAEELGDQIMTEEQRADFREDKEIDFAFGLQGVSRFRANLYNQCGTVAMAIRTVPLEIPRFEDLNLPDTLVDLMERKRGLVLVTGTVGSGKSTTLAALIDHVNRHQCRNVLTIEDPVEFLHRDKQSLISQREVGLDTASYGDGLRYILRQDPDVIMLGEIRDKDTMRVSLMAADTGHLVLSTLHTANAPQTINRILSFYPPHQHGEMRFLMATTLAAIVTLRLVPRADGAGRVPAVEVMVASETIKEMILDAEKTAGLKQAIQDGVNTHGMQSFDQSLMKLYSTNLITLEQAIRHSSNPTEFQLRIQGVHSSSDTSWDHFEKKADRGPAEQPTGEEALDGFVEEATGTDDPEGISRF